MHIPRIGTFLGLLAWCSLVLTAGTLAQQQQPAPTPQEPAASQSAPGAPTAPGSQAAAPSLLQGVLLSTATLLGTDVRNPLGEEIGEIRQLMIDPQTGRVQYAVVAMGGFLGLGEKDILVPWRAMGLARDGNSLVLNVSRELLQDMPGDEPGRQPTPGERHQEEAGAGSGGWGAETPYAQLYDPTREQTISGQVTSLETAPPLPGMAPGMQMLIQAEDGKAIRVHTGPAWYLERQDGMLQENTRVQVTGVLTEVEGQPVLLAREVRFNGQVLTLRDAQGLPMWSSLRRSE
jgi:sporulation protein YlmC with PRC-barrel domain